MNQDLLFFLSPVHSNDRNGPTILCLFGQWGPSKPGSYSHRFPGQDTYSKRKEWFRMCLDILDSEIEDEQVVMPYKIGCGLAGGNWSEYLRMIQNCKTKVRLYQI